MTTTFQISDKRGDAILLVKTEAASAGEAYQEFGAAVQDAGLDTSLNAFGTGLVQAVASAQPLIGAQGQTWGQPPVPAYQPPMPAAAAPQAAPGGAPVCQHGPKEYKSGVGAKGPWAFWGCKARSDDPTKCEKEWAR